MADICLDIYLRCKRDHRQWYRRRSGSFWHLYFFGGLQPLIYVEQSRAKDLTVWYTEPNVYNFGAHVSNKRTL